MGNIAAYVAVLVVGAAVTMVANVPARIISQRAGYSAQPDERKVHETVTPYGGGAAMLVGFCVALLVAVAISPLRSVITSSHEMIGVLIAAGVIFVVGLLDDFREMSAPAKVAGQVLAASVLYFSGCTMYQLKLPFAGFVVLGPSILPLITAAWVFALTNAVNLIDGIDGLATGVGILVVVPVASDRPGCSAKYEADQRGDERPPPETIGELLDRGLPGKS